MAGPHSRASLVKVDLESLFDHIHCDGSGAVHLEDFLQGFLHVTESARTCSYYSRLFELAGTENVLILVVNVLGVNLDFGC